MAPFLGNKKTFLSSPLRSSSGRRAFTRAFQDQSKKVKAVSFLKRKKEEGMCGGKRRLVLAPVEKRETQDAISIFTHAISFAGLATPKICLTFGVFILNFALLLSLCGKRFA